LTRRISDREVHPALRHLEYHNGCDTRTYLKIA
jgi:hypothetical protein